MLHSKVVVGRTPEELEERLNEFLRTMVLDQTPSLR